MLFPPEACQLHVIDDLAKEGHALEAKQQLQEALDVYVAVVDRITIALKNDSTLEQGLGEKLAYYRRRVQQLKVGDVV